jgi:hypothetical protein
MIQVMSARKVQIWQLAAIDARHWGVSTPIVHLNKLKNSVFEKGGAERVASKDVRCLKQEFLESILWSAGQELCKEWASRKEARYSKKQSWWREFSFLPPVLLDACLSTARVQIPME